MAKRDQLMFFEDFEEDVKPVEAPTVDKPITTKTSNKKTESRAISKNLLMSNDDYEYDVPYANQSSKKSVEVEEEKKDREVIWEPGSNSRKKQNNLPELKKQNAQTVKKEINIEHSNKAPRRESPTREDNDDEHQEVAKPKDQESPNRRGGKRIKLSERKQLNSDEDNELERLELSPSRNPSSKPKNTFHEQQEQEIPKQQPIKKQGKKEQKKEAPQIVQMPQLDSGSDVEAPPLASHPGPSVEIKLQPEHLRSVNIADIANRRQFLTSPIPQGRQLQCTIKREKGSLGLFPQYDVFLSNEYRYLMSAKKRSGNATSNYLITADKNDMETNSPNYLGKVRSNFMGTCFQIYDDGCNPEKVQPGKICRKVLASVHYASNIFGSKGPRKMEVYVPDPAKNPTTVPDRDLKEHWEKEPEKFVQLLNKPPKWNQLKQIYMLDFKGRVDKPSVKNFILTHKDQDEPLILLFGRVGQDVFHLDLMYPLSPVQALGIVMTSFDTKLACE